MDTSRGRLVTNTCYQTTSRCFEVSTSVTVLISCEKYNKLTNKKDYKIKYFVFMCVDMSWIELVRKVGHNHTTKQQIK